MKRIKILFTAASIIVATISVHAQQPWEYSIDANMLTTQNSYSDNWDGGESGSMIWVMNANLTAKKMFSEMLTNRTSLKLSFGQTHNQDAETKKWAGPEKSTDLIDLESVLLFDFNLGLSPFLAGRFESEFLDVSDKRNKRNFNPMRFTESIGASRTFIEKEKRGFTARAGFAVRQLIDRDVIIDSVLRTKETQSEYDGGLEMVSELTSPLAKERINLTSKLILYKALFYSQSDELQGLPNQDYWKMVDVSWENIFTANITKYLIVNLYLQWLYDKEISKGGRLKQTLSLGLTYKFL